MLQRQITQELYVHPTQGNDSAAGSSTAPFKTLTRALQQVKPGMLIQLSRGIYSAESGEQFPLVLRGDVMVVGNLPTQGKGVVIQGGGLYQSEEFGSQNVTLVLQGTAELQGVTVTNPAPKGTGVWIEADRPLMSGCALSGCGREGVFITGEADPVISSCLFEDNGASGLALVRDARGEVRSNILRQNGLGLVISDRAAPILSSNQFQENRSGLVISGLASPVLRGNILSQNREDGLVVLGQATPDLGQRYDPAGNRFRDNQRYDLRHSAPQPLTTVGNQLNPARLSGAVELQSTGTPALVPPAQSLSPSLAASPTSHSQPWTAPLTQVLLDRQILPADSLTSQAVTAAVWLSWVERAGLAAADLSAAELDLETGTRPLTRLQVIVSLVKLLNLPKAPAAMLRPYRDRAQVPSAATAGVATALRHRLILSPSPDRLFPLQEASRAEAAAMLYQALALRQQVASIEIPQILRVSPPLVPPPRRRRPPIVVLDPGHGGSDPGVVTEAEAEEPDPGTPEPLLSSNEMMMSPLPAGNLNNFPELVEFGLPDQSPLLPPMVASLQASMQSPMQAQLASQLMEPPPGMPVERNRDPDAPAELPSLEEKTVNLAVAEAVANFLQQQGIQVVLTRTGDEARSLAERVAVAAEQKADLFVSLHANASLTQQTSLNGIETYHHPSSVEGRRLAWAIHKSLTRSSDVVDRGVHSATFLTLQQTWPSVHVEVGYITGSQDAPSLANLAYHRFLGRSIANGILRYVRQQEAQSAPPTV
jgi:parallel beta-helix repeat protein